jgi:diguanylate cyclase (GGDEF)-like protein/PAS domain S-box-containing protein
MNDLATTDPPHAATPSEVLQGALIDSRQRWRELVNLAADFTFETDEWGRFALITPDPALGWATATLIGQPASMLLAEGADAMFDPFRVSARIHHRQAWLKRGDGGVACLTFRAAPIQDPTGRIAGVRGVGIDMTECDKQAAGVAVALRRAEVLDHILWCMGQEILIPRMMGAVLNAIANAMGAEGAAVILAPTDQAAALLAHVSGTGAEQVLDAAGGTLRLSGPHPEQTTATDGRPVLVAGCQTRFGQKAGLVTWRTPAARGWDDDDSQLIGSAVNIIRMVLEHEATQREMTRQARTDPLTGLLNRRAFLEEMERHAARQDRENQPATLMFADLDNFKPVNDRLGHEAGDEVLRCTAALLRRTFRPTDLIARLGGDEFAIWLNGADHMTAAERAEFLRDEVPRELADITGPDGPRVSLSIGIASRAPGEGEALDSLMRRADRAMYEVKRGGRGHWRVSLRRRPSDGVR